MNLTQIKAQLRVTHDAEDDLIQNCWDSASALVTQMLGDDMPDPVPDPINSAILLLTEDLYVNRGRQSDRVLHENSTFNLLLAPYRTKEVL